MKPALAVITNSFNRRDLLGEALPSLLGALRALSFECTVVVFDAGSKDGSQEFVQQQAAANPDVPIHLITPQPPEAGSFADGCNQAVAHALQTYPSVRWCFFYETDNLLPNHDALKEAVRLLEENESLAGTGFTVEKRGGQKTGFGCCFPGMVSFLLGQQLAARLHLDDMVLQDWRSTPRGVRWALCDVVYTSPLLIRAAAWQAVQGMDTRLFPFTDSDVDLAWKVHKTGGRFAILDMPGVIHDNDSTPSAWSSRRVLWFHQSRLRLLRKHLLGGRADLLKPLLFARHLAEWLLLAPRALLSARSRQSLKTRGMLLSRVFQNYE